MTRATRQAKALQAVIQAMRTTIAKEAARQEGPEF